MNQKSANQSFLDHLDRRAQHVETVLDQFLTRQTRPNEILRPAKLIDAMRHSVLNGGKRLRPFLVMEVAELFNVDPSESGNAAAAIECIHCYSLVHDDLPAMDDDDLRRGKPTTHKVYGEALAILAGDGLLTLAFEILADKTSHPNAEVRSDLVSELSVASGLAGMVGGQHLDLAAEDISLNQEEILTMQSMKTGALLKAACAMGGLLGEASKQEMDALRQFGQAIGQAFQLADDILDVTATVETMGKATAKDRDRGKATIVAQLGLDQSIELAHKLAGEAKQSLSLFGGDADRLRQTADFVIHRMH